MFAVFRGRGNTLVVDVPEDVRVLLSWQGAGWRGQGAI